MLTVASLAADALGDVLAEEINRTFGSSQRSVAEVVGSVARTAIECISNSDALYHNLEHTLLVTLVGRDILRGRALTEHAVPSDWAHFLIACLLHDIGYVRGVLKGDGEAGYVVDAAGTCVTLPRGASDASLEPHHVERSKLFVMERIGGLSGLGLLDAERIAAAIEATRFPVKADAADAGTEPALVRAADLVGQLGDPHYLRKANALYAEFAENGIDQRLGYQSPADLVERYPEFFWKSVSPFLGPAIRYLNVTVSGRQWIANLNSNIFCAERALRLSGPQR
jgi:hypothetical protein